MKQKLKHFPPLIKTSPRHFLLHDRVPLFSSASTHSDEVDQGVVEVGAFGQEEAAPGAEVVEEEQILFLDDDKQSVLNIMSRSGSGQTGLDGRCGGSAGAACL